MKLKSKTVSGREVDIKDVEAAYVNKQKIALIKMYRDLTSYGLKESKERVESAWDSLNEMRKLFYDASTVPYHMKITKKQMLRLLEKALDAEESMYFTDKIELLECVISNIKEQARYKDMDLKPEAFLALKYEEFIEGI